MKCKVTLVLIFIIISSGLMFGQSDVKTLEALYKNSTTIKEKNEVTKRLLGSASSDAEPLLMEILNDQSVTNIVNRQDQTQFNEWVHNTMEVLDKAGIKSGAVQMRKIFDMVTDYTYKGEILLAIGNTGDKNLLPWLNSLLDKVNNNNRNGKKDYPESYIYNLIEAIGMFNDPSSFQYLFYAANPAYGVKTRKLAQDKLAGLTNDPAPYCAEYIKTENDQLLILNALYYAINSGSPAENKILACKAALYSTMFTEAPPDQKSTQNEIRDEAASYLGEYKASDKDIIDLIAKKWDFDKNINSRLVTIQALEKIGTEDSAKILADKLDYYIDKTGDGARLGMTEQEGNRLVIALIRALGNIPNSIGIEELNRLVTSPDFGDIIKREAAAALKKKPAVSNNKKQ